MGLGYGCVPQFARCWQDQLKAADVKGESQRILGDAAVTTAMSEAFFRTPDRCAARDESSTGDLTYKGLTP